MGDVRLVLKLRRHVLPAVPQPERVRPRRSLHQQLTNATTDTNANRPTTDTTANVANVAAYAFTDRVRESLSART